MSSTLLGYRDEIKSVGRVVNGLIESEDERIDKIDVGQLLELELIVEGREYTFTGKYNPLIEKFYLKTFE